MYSQLGETELNIVDMDDLFEIKALKKKKHAFCPDYENEFIKMPMH